MSQTNSKSSRPDCFRALSDPTRRAMFNLLAHGELTVSQVAESFTVSQPAVSQHLSVLRSARLVRERKDGRFRYYRADPTGLKPVIDWIAQYESFWRQKLSRLKTILDRSD